MALRAKAPKEVQVQKRLKAFFYGMPKVGKTTAAISFPKPYLIDTERGSENNAYTDILERNGGVIFQTSDFNEILKEIKSLMTEKHEFKTLIIDPFTMMYNDLVEKCAEELRSKAKEHDATGMEFGRHIALADKKVRHMINLLYKLDMNVIITSHAKKEYNDKMNVIGTTFDCYKKMDYIFDLILEIQKRGKRRVAITKGTRFPTEFPEDDTFDFSYDEIANRYGREILERDAKEIEFATPEQIEEFKHYVEILKIPKESVDKWLDKADAEDVTEFSKDIIQKLINSFIDTINRKGATNV